MNEILKIIIQSLITSSFIGGAVIYIFKRVIEQYLNKNLEKFKKELDKEIEFYKLHLNLIYDRQSKLYLIRLKVIETLYQKLVDLYNAILEMTAPAKIITGKDDATVQQEEKEIIEKTAKLGNDFFHYYQKKKIYFSEETCELIEKIEQGLKQSYNDYSFKYLFGMPTSKMTYELAKRASDNVRKEIPKLLKLLENEFRKSIGIINNK